MIGSINQLGTFGISPLMHQAVSGLSTQQQSLQLQAATGVVSDSYAGLGDTRSQALSLEPAITQVSAWSSNITSTQSNLSLTQNTLSAIGTIATTLGTTIATLGGTPNTSTIQAAAAQARSSLQSLNSLLNTRSGSSYVFAGVQSLTAPIPAGTDLASGPLASAIAASVGQLGTIGASAVLSQTQDAAATTTPGNPFSAALSIPPGDASGLVSTPSIGTNQSVAAGVVATQGGAPSATSTGSPIRDLMRNLMIVASLTPATASTAGYGDLVKGLGASATETGEGITGLAANLGVTQNTLTTQAGMLAQMQTALATQLGNSKDADLASVSTQLTSVQNSLQASYSLIADMKGMTLADYI